VYEISHGAEAIKLPFAAIFTYLQVSNSPSWLLKMDATDINIEKEAQNALDNSNCSQQSYHARRSLSSSRSSTPSIIAINTNRTGQPNGTLKELEFIRRAATHRSQHLGTVGRNTNAKEGCQLPPFGDVKDYPPSLPGRELYVVEFDGKDDPLHGTHWSTGKK
jgi:DHA1 family multidrug resistance protein-like MFS transporter